MPGEAAAEHPGGGKETVNCVKGHGMSVYGQDGEKWAVVPHLAGHLAGCSDEARPEQADPRTCDLFIFSK